MYEQIKTLLRDADGKLPSPEVAVTQIAVQFRANPWEAARQRFNLVQCLYHDLYK